MKKIIVIGSINLDLVFQVANFVQAGETISSKSMHTHFGGKGLNQAIALAKASDSVYLGAHLNAQDLHIKTQIEAFGLHTEHILSSELPTGSAFIQVNERGQNCIVLNSGANADFNQAKFEQILANFKKDDLLVLQNEINDLGILIKRAKEKGLKIAFNPSPWHEIIRQLPLNELDYLILNEVEGEALTKKTQSKDIIRSLENTYPNTCCVLTLGSEGVIATHKGVNVKLPSRKVNVVDTTAAGDTFTGYFLASMQDGKTLEESLNIATNAAAITVTRPGASNSIPNKQEVLAYGECHAS